MRWTACCAPKTKSTASRNSQRFGCDAVVCAIPGPDTAKAALHDFPPQFAPAACIYDPDRSILVIELYLVSHAPQLLTPDTRTWTRLCPAGLWKWKSDKTCQPEWQLDCNSPKGKRNGGVFFLGLDHRGGKHRPECL